MNLFTGLVLAAAATLASVLTKAHQEGIASWYGGRHEGRLMTNGERFRSQAAYCAHRNLPLGTRIEVRNLHTQKSASCLVTDRGPYRAGRIVDVSEAVAQEIGLREAGVAPARVTVLADR